MALHGPTVDKMGHAYSFKTRLMRVSVGVVRRVFFRLWLLQVMSEISASRFQVLRVLRGVYVDHSFLNAVAPIPLVAMRVKG